MAQRFISGLIEGFYGRTWSWEARADWCNFLKEQRQDFYLYAPKADRFLREQWLEQWPRETLKELVKFRTHCSDQSIQFGVGFSPFEIHLNWNQETKRQLQKRLEELKPLELELLGLLFDDMKGAEATMASIQSEIAHRVAEQLPDTRLILCPTYYTDDPILKALFGLEPQGYLEELGEKVDRSIDIFWTGPLVCSAEYSESHLRKVEERMGRKPFIWDNYPVNDGSRMAPFLHLQPPHGRPERPELFTSGFGINPMNQPELSKIPTAPLFAEWRNGEKLDEKERLALALSTVNERSLEKLIERDLELFQERGIGLAGTIPSLFESWERNILNSETFSLLTSAEQQQLREESDAFARKLPNSLSEEERRSLAQEYREIDHPMAREIVDWLEGGYAFKPL